MIKTRAHIALALGGALVLGAVWTAAAQTPPPPPGGPPPLGGPIDGLDAQRRAEWDEGRRAFGRVHGIADGLGPVFNGRSCVECHLAPAPGGSGGDLLRSRVTRFGRVVNGVFDPLERLGGSLVQRRSIRELDPACPIPPEQVPLEANTVSRRITTPLFGDGLIQAIPDAAILAKADPADANRDGISGAVNRGFNPETGRLEIGRFGWKSQVSTLHLFAGDAYLNEMGITTPTFPRENLPQGRPIPAGWDRAADPEDGGPDVDALTSFMRDLAPPARRPLGTAAARGEQLFTQSGCAACHTPSMRTAGPDPVLANRVAFLYSDLLVHDMGTPLADGIPAGTATGREWRTAPLWGLRARRFFLHDGRATTVDQAIRFHDGEGRASAARYGALSATDRDAMLQFLAAL